MLFDAPDPEQNACEAFRPWSDPAVAGDLVSTAKDSRAFEQHPDQLAIVAGWARTALLKEVSLTPKPGLVDLRNSGSHRDMDYQTFLVSTEAITPYFNRFCQTGAAASQVPTAVFLPLIRPIGIACERAMFAATDNVNTHKGAIFSMGLFCAAAGRLMARASCAGTNSGSAARNAAGAGNGRGLPRQAELCTEVAAICAGLVENDLVPAANPKTVGEKLFRYYGMTGIRGEAASGYLTVRHHALPVFHDLTARGHAEEIALLQSLLSLMAHNQDTNLFGRGGMEGMNFVRRRAGAFLEAGGVLAPGGVARMAEFDDELIALNLSPGGSADLLAVCWFLSRFPR